MAMKNITYSKQALRALRAMPETMAKRIMREAEQYAKNPAAQANNIKALQGAEYSECYRLRVGDWRIILSDDGAVIAVIRIAAGGSVY